MKLSLTRSKRTLAVLSLFIICACPLTGCAPKDDAVDAPLIKDAGPPPPRPNKPSIAPSGPGGGESTGTSGTATGSAK
jgi:hypothetical protein